MRFFFENSNNRLSWALDAGTSFNKIRISLPNTEMQHPSKYPRPKIVRTLIAGHKDHSERHEDGGEGDEERVQAHQHRPD